MRFGVEKSETIKETKLCDKQNKNDMWKNDIKKELLKVKVAFELIE